MINPAVWRREVWILFGAVLLRAVRDSTITLFVQSGRIRASAQGDVEQFKICICAELFRQFYCCSCPLWELELLCQETVYIVYIMPLLRWFVVETKINKILSCSRNSHWYTYCGPFIHAFGVSSVHRISYLMTKTVNIWLRKLFAWTANIHLPQYIGGIYSILLG